MCAYLINAMIQIFTNSKFLKRKQLIIAIIVFEQNNRDYLTINSPNWIPLISTVWTQTFLKISSIVFHRSKKVNNPIG